MLMFFSEHASWILSEHRAALVFLCSYSLKFNVRKVLYDLTIVGGGGVEVGVDGGGFGGADGFGDLL